MKIAAGGMCVPCTARRLKSTISLEVSLDVLALSSNPNATIVAESTGDHTALRCVGLITFWALFWPSGSQQQARHQQWATKKSHNSLLSDPEHTKTRKPITGSGV